MESRAWNSGSEPNTDIPMVTRRLPNDKHFAPQQEALSDSGDSNHEYNLLVTEDDSPYPEVRAAVPNIDNPALPQNTIRMWTLGLLMTTIGSGLNVLFSLHAPTFALSPFVSSVLSWPLGRLWERVVPNVSVFGIPLNPGKFNLKEHALVTIMANVSFGSGAAYLTEVVTALRYFYGINFGWGFRIVATMSSQALGYSIAGLVRRVLVYPASMIWPTNLVTSTFLTNIHLNVNHVADGWRISRLKFFGIVTSCSFVWTWFPQFFAPFLSYFSFPSWISPDNVVMNQLFGTQSGLALIPITFDWNQIAGYIGSPLVPPYFAIANVLAATALVFWVVCPIIHYSNVWYGHYLPMSTSDIYDRFQHIYNVTRILTPDHELDEEKYSEYSPLFLPTTYAMAYCVSFAAITAAIVHTILYDGKDVLYYWRNSQSEPDDVHMRLIKRYKEVPDWWFAVCFVVFFAMALVSVRVWSTQLPVWALILALVLAFVCLIPVAIIFALTNIQVGLNVISELIVGYAVPGKPVAMMMFKTFGYITNIQAVSFLQDMKLGHYLKIAPRLLFIAQLVATIWGAVVQLLVLQAVQEAVPDLCSRTQKLDFSCPSGRVFYESSVVWGLIGPGRQFSAGTLYNASLYCFLLGALLPVVTWLWVKKRPRSFARIIHWPVFFNGLAYLPPATVYNYGTFCAVGLVFGYWIKRTWFNWWAKYNYSLSAGLDIGLAFGSLLIFLISLSPNINPPEWWGSNGGGAFDTADSRAETVIKLSSGQSFGPSSWKS
uniref:ARAD1A01166p n=1 Tax=Blastobotrys adeninivorans TaxID=409370 RepID=A0A060SX18_BLAAD